MRCPKCKLITFEGNILCPRCGEDLTIPVQTLGPFYKFSTKEVFLKDTLLKPPPFIEPPELDQVSEMPLPPLPEEESSSKSQPMGTSSGSEGKKEEGVLKELEEVLKEDQG